MRGLCTVVIIAVYQDEYDSGADYGDEDMPAKHMCTAEAQGARYSGWYQQRRRFGVHSLETLVLSRPAFGASMGGLLLICLTPSLVASIRATPA